MKIKKTFCLGLWMLLLIPGFGQSEEPVQNIIFMVPDGMGISNVTAARLYRFGSGESRLFFETLPRIGYHSTYSQSGMITDSAAAASAWACGEKFNNGEISYHRETGTAPQTIMEIARELGKGTGLVATSSVTHATPAAFAAHVPRRGQQEEIARQMVRRTRPDVMLGAGLKYFSGEDDLIREARENGYRVVTSARALREVEGPGFLLGLFAPRKMTPMHEREKDHRADQEPTLAEMTQKALSVLEHRPKGFFLLVEGSQVDWANHENNLVYQIKETIAFDQAVKAVLDWIGEKPGRAGQTLLIVVPDHETGGFAILGPSDRVLGKPGQLVKPGWVSRDHTGEDTLIWSQGPYSEHLGRAIDNTDIFHIMKAALRGEPYQKQHTRSGALNR